MIDQHYSVLLTESIKLLNIKPDGIYVDGTFGRGGHAREILNNLNSQGKLIAFDKDEYAHEYAQKYFDDERLILIHDTFARLRDHLLRLSIKQVDGILLDLGVSSPQLDDKDRGFSFRFDGPLDMRMDMSRGVTAFQWINSVEESALADVLWRYGEERFSRQIARAIINKRHLGPISTTKELVQIIDDVLPFKEKGKSPATRSFQAIRIFINNELSDLEDVLAQAPEIMALNSRMVIISFHSLEDRIVKTAFNHLSGGEQLPKWVMANPSEPNFKVIAKKVKASAYEVEENIRSRSGIMRAIERVK